MDDKFRFSDADGLVNFGLHKKTLDKLFFRSDFLLSSNAKDMEDFWKFVDKYQNALSLKLKETNAGRSSNSICQEKLRKMNFIYTNDRLEEHITRLRRDDDFALENKHLSIANLRHFNFICMLFYECLQKQKFAKLLKLKRDQSSLPISQYRDSICQSLLTHQVLVVAGDTGCGKSTQVPQYLARLPGLQRMEPTTEENGLEPLPLRIVVTQPRRIACTSLAARVSFETLNVYGNEVGYQVRFEKMKNKATRILFMTEGLLLRQLQSDPYLSSYTVIILDEVHERHIHTDFLLGVLKCLVQVRKDLRLVLMSATINVEMFSAYFNNCPIVRVPGRLYPIKVEYHPLKLMEESSKSERIDPTPYLKIIRHIDNAYNTTERGDLLIFVSGLSDIETIVEAARQYAEVTKRWIVLPLHSTLSVEEQEKVFDVAPDGVRKCVVSTNISETSVTIDGIRFVLDSGKVKEMNWDSGTNMQRLKQFPISKASAEQRKGRAGRTGPGVCFRLYSEEEYSEFQDFTSPDIQRLPLDTLILQMLSMGLPDIRRFPFIEAPPSEKVNKAMDFLKEQSAIDSKEQLTCLGSLLAQLPMDVQLGKMLLLATAFHVIEPVLTLVSALSVSNPLTARAYSNSDMQKLREPLDSDHGDPFMLMNIFNEWMAMKAERHKDSRKWCRQRGIEEQRLYEISKLRQQLQTQLAEHKLYIIPPKEVHDSSHRSRSSIGQSHEHYQVHLKRELRRARREKKISSKRRKILSLDENTHQGAYSSDEEENEDRSDEAMNVPELEFRLQHGLASLQEWADWSKSLTTADISLLKIILSAGLYPQFAVPDESNNYEYGSEQMFHTRSQGFLVLHPNDYFSNFPECLRPREVKGIASKGTSILAKRSIIANHQLLAYISLLETTKPFIMHSIRIPAFPSLLLFSRKLDTDATLSRLVFDEWLEITPIAEEKASCEEILLAAIRVRIYFEGLVFGRLSELQNNSKSESTVKVPSSSSKQGLTRLERLSSKLIIQFLNARSSYSMRQILAAERKTLFPKCSEEEEPVELVAGFINYNSIGTNEEIEDTREDIWDCPECLESLIGNTEDRLYHVAVCAAQSLETMRKQQEKITEESRDVESRRDSSTADEKTTKRHFVCDGCGQSFYLSQVDVLRHRKSCCRH